MKEDKFLLWLGAYWGIVGIILMFITTILLKDLKAAMIIFFLSEVVMFLSCILHFCEKLYYINREQQALNVAYLELVMSERKLANEKYLNSEKLKGGDKNAH